MGLFLKLSQWRLNKYYKKQQKIQQKTQIASINKTRKLLGDLYNFVSWLNTKGIGNRHQRKIFWRKVMNGEPLVEKMINTLDNQYLAKLASLQSERKPKEVSKVKDTAVTHADVEETDTDA